VDDVLGRGEVDNPCPTREHDLGLVFGHFDAWSQVRDPRRCAGNDPMVLISPSRTDSAVWSTGRCTSMT
jgi:hypothetical protein